VFPPHRKPTVLIVDDDLGFVMWLGEIFTELGWNTVPASDCQGALTLVGLLHMDVDLIVVNPALEGVSQMVGAFSRVRRPKIVLIGGPDVVADIPADATLDRPDIGTPVSRAEWTKRVQKLVRKIGLA